MPPSSSETPEAAPPPGQRTGGFCQLVRIVRRPGAFELPAELEDISPSHIGVAAAILERKMISCNAPECACHDSLFDAASGACSKCAHDRRVHADYSLLSPVIVAKVLLKGPGEHVQRVLCLTCNGWLRGYLGEWIGVIAAVQEHRSQTHNESSGSVSGVCVTENQWVQYVRLA